MFSARLPSLALAALVLTLGGYSPQSAGQAARAAAGAGSKVTVACKGTVRAAWNNCTGTYTTTEGAVYVGEFRNGKYNGEGTATWPNGDRYVGGFRDDKFHGQGIYTAEKNFVYVGEFRDGMFNGIGTYTSSSGMKYFGEWRDDEKNGQGTYTWPSGRVYVGQFRDDDRDGQGAETMPDGQKYVGEFREGKRWGNGTLYDPSGRVLQSGVWREDRFESETAVAAAAPAPALTPAPAPALTSTPTAAAADRLPASGARSSLAVADTYPAADAAAESLPGSSPEFASESATIATAHSAVTVPTSAGSSGPARVALVIGNQTYSSIPPLRNARADAEAMAAALDNLGFDVMLRTDLDDRSLRQTMREFKGRLDGGSEAVFYFAGHGVQLGAANYLLPTNITPESEEQVKDDALQLQRVLDDLAEQKVRFSVAIVDACRDNPFPKNGTRSIGGTRGLAPTTAATGQMILFSAGAGQTALDFLSEDDKDPNGLFTRVLLREINRPGLPVDQVLKRTRQEVVAMAKTVGHEQVPALYDQTVGEFYFSPAVAGSPAAAAPVAAAPAAAVPIAFAAQPTDDRALWESVRDTKNPEEIEAYLAQFPQGLFAGVAAARLRSLQGGGTSSPTAAPAVSASVAAAPAASAGSATAPGKAAAGGIAASGTVLVATSTTPISDLQKLATGTVFRDCAECPEMVVIAGGSFDMGDADFRKARRPNEGPARRVNVPGPFAVGRIEVTWTQYARFVRETSRLGGLGCATYQQKRFKVNAQAGWNSPGFPQTENDPVVCVSWDDAKAYAEWLGVKTGRNYRLLTEAEWEYTVRAGTEGDQFWGDNPADACRYANVADATGRGSLGLEQPFDCRDRHAGTAPAGSFQPNPFGVHDLFGNVEEWTMDCWSDTYRNAPTNGTANTAGDCDRRVLRGGSWFDGTGVIRATARAEDAVGSRYTTRGFRLARTN